MPPHHFQDKAPLMTAKQDVKHISTLSARMNLDKLDSRLCIRYRCRRDLCIAPKSYVVLGLLGDCDISFSQNQCWTTLCELLT